MATLVSLNGTSYSIPAYGDSGWAQGAGNLSSYLISLASVTLQPIGGNFTLTAPLNFGSGFGVTLLSLTTASASPATAMLPWWGFSSRLMHRKNVLLPDPELPMMLITSPAWAVSETPLSTSLLPKRLWMLVT